MEELWQSLSQTLHLDSIGDVGYHIVALALGGKALVKGFRRGLTRQVCALLGFGFGVVCAHLFADDGQRLVRATLPSLEDHCCAGFIYSLLSATGIYVVVFCAFRWLTGVLDRAVRVLDTGIFDALLGSGFNLTKTLLGLSMAYNSLICINPTHSRLMKYASDSDGNVVEGVMRMAPALLGCMSFEELAHILQLREAKKISQNIPPTEGVLNTEGPTASSLHSLPATHNQENRKLSYQQCSKSQTCTPASTAKRYSKG